MTTLKSAKLSTAETLDLLSGDYSIAMGRHSRIPDCCIFFWYTTYMSARGYSKSYFKTLNTKKSFGYIPCPKCFSTDNRVRIHLCTLRCKQWYIDNKFDVEWLLENVSLKRRGIRKVRRVQ